MNNFQLFFRIINNKLYGSQVQNLGFASTNPPYIPDEYLENKEFVVMRTCHGIGDWCIISAIPRLLKQKYPDCKVYIPSGKMLKEIFGDMLNDWGYGTFNAVDTVNNIFKNNPYVDDFIDSIDGEIFHDHFKIYDTTNDKIPLAKQMLKFWQFKDNEIIDTTPDFYPTEEELNWFNNFNKYNDYGYILASSSFENGDPIENLLSVIDEYKNTIKNWYYYGEVDFKDSSFNSMGLSNVIEIKPLNLTIRQQQLLKTKANVNFGNETGMSLWTAKYSKSYVLGHTTYTQIHGEDYKGRKRKRPFQSGNFVEDIIYL
tara:strand:+ start:7405 stop:8346 length:942 start_codon:yes stop_codon:yes gene_type:complete